MDPSTLEMMLMLRMNKHAWSRETLQEILDDKKKPIIYFNIFFGKPGAILVTVSAATG